MRQVLDGIRAVWRSKAFLAACAATCASAVAPGLSALAVVDRMFLRPLPYTAPERIVLLYSQTVGGSEPYLGISASDVITLDDGADALDEIAYVSRSRTAVVDGLGPQPATIAFATSNLLAVLGVRPLVGRGFTADDRAVSPKPLLLSYSIWRSRFGGSTEVLERTIGSGAQRFTIVGVLPPSFVLPSSNLLPRLDGLSIDASMLNAPAAAMAGWVVPAPIARLHPGSTVRQAQEEADALLASEAGAGTASKGKPAPTVLLVGVQEGMTLPYRAYVRLLLAGVVLLWLAGAVSLTLLFAGRAQSRRAELAGRAALGATRLQLLRHLAGEVAVVVALGVGTAIVAVWFTSAALTRQLPAVFAGYVAPVNDPRLLAMTVASTLILVLIVTGVVGWRITAVRAVDIRTLMPSSTRPFRRAAGALVGCQAALAVLLAGAAVVVSANLARILWSGLGFDPADVYIFRLQHGRATDPVSRRFAAQDVIRAQPGVTRMAFTSDAPVGAEGPAASFWLDHGEPRGRIWGVSGGVDKIMRLTLRGGRSIRDSDVDAALSVGVVSEAAAARLWPGVEVTNVVGRSLETPTGRLRVVGVVDDVRPIPGEAAPPLLMVPLGHPLAESVEGRLVGLLRTEPGARPDARRLDAELDARLGSGDLSLDSLADVLDRWRERPRFQAAVFGPMAAAAGLFLVGGVVAVVQHEVARRRRELALRRALGGTSLRIAGAVAGHLLSAVVVGAGTGAALASLLSRVLEAAVPNVSGTIGLSYMLVGISIVGVAVLVAGAILYRTSGVQLAQALRSE